MYIDKLTLTNVRTFVKNELRLLHPDSVFRSPKTEPNGNAHLLPKPKLPNVNLLLGDNGSGKTTVLQAIALASLGPAAERSGLPLRPFVRFKSKQDQIANQPNEALIQASLVLHPQDNTSEKSIESVIEFHSQEELEFLTFERLADKPRPKDYGVWEPVFESQNDALFCAAYGATRRVDTGDSLERGSAPKTHFLRGQRLQSIFQDSFALFPLAYWLPPLKKGNPGRYKQVVGLLNKMLAPSSYRFTEEMYGQEYLFERGGMRVPFRSLSDGYRAFIAWVADLLYHICYGCPSGKMLVESSGVVLVDEIDLHLHPKWQMKVVGTIAKALPQMQFILTSHSPLIVGSLEWMNIITLRASAATNRTVTKRLKQSVHGLDADQILLTDFFGLKTTRASSKSSQLNRLRNQATVGDDDDKLAYVRALSSGTEGAGETAGDKEAGE